MGVQRARTGKSGLTAVKMLAGPVGREASGRPLAAYILLGPVAARSGKLTGL